VAVGQKRLGERRADARTGADDQRDALIHADVLMSDRLNVTRSLPYRCDPGVDGNVLRMKTRCSTVEVKLDIHARPEDQAMRGPPKMEHSDLFALPDALPF